MSATPILKQQLRVATRLKAVSPAEAKHFEKAIDEAAKTWAEKSTTVLAAPKRRAVKVGA